MLPTTKRNTVSLRVTVLSVSIVLRTCLLRPAAKGADIMPIASSGEGSAAGRSSVLRATDRSLCSPRLAGQGERGRRAGICMRRVAEHMCMYISAMEKFVRDLASGQSYSHPGSVVWAGVGSVGFTPGAGRGSGREVVACAAVCGQGSTAGQVRVVGVIIAGLTEIRGLRW